MRTSSNAVFLVFAGALVATTRPGSALAVDAVSFAVSAVFLRRLEKPPALCLVNHGEQRSAERLRDRIDDELGWTAVVPRDGERVVVAR